MNKIVKILLVILAVLIIAGAGFWGGTQFAYRQTAINTANQTALNCPFSDGARPGFGMMGPNSGNRGWSDDDNLKRGYNGSGNFGPGMMGRNGFSPNMMNQSSRGFTGMFPGGGLFGGGLMLLGLIFPLGILVLIVLGIIVLFRMVRTPSVNATQNNQSNN
jgi:hypothetical protein